MMIWRSRRRTRSGFRRRLSVLLAPLLTVACAAVMVPLLDQPASGSVEPPITEPMTGNATWFDALGAPYGGCGLPQGDLDSQNFIALNVYDTPKDYTFYPRPMPAGDPKIGLWDNGHNCGRWVEVTIGDFCTGVNDGAPGEAFCKRGEWTADKYNGAKLMMIVADSCGDSNAWCREDPYHIDMAHKALNQFVKDGAPVKDMDPDSWNNRHVSWKFVPAPNYSGDVQIGFLAGSKSGWTAVAVNHLANGIHGLDYWSSRDQKWVDATMDGDMGQAFIIKPYDDGGSSYAVRVRDVNDQYINDGRVYGFDLPANCDPQCADPYQKITYTVGTEPPGGGPSSRTCTATAKTVQSWPGGFEGKVTVTAGESKIYGWKVAWTMGSGQTMGDAWNGTRTVDGSKVTMENSPWNGTLAPGASMTFGFIGFGDGPMPEMTCAAT
ncbi:MAG: Cellulose-binding protein [Actinomycetota bacterium]|nr:Cellulose-binding protein [Actinomycetota bacterium]